MNVSAYLSKLDGEIKQHRQEIALHQVEIARLEDARRVIIGLAEKDEARAHGEAPALLGNYEKPLLIVRQARAEAAAEAVARAEPHGPMSIDDRLDETRERKRERDHDAYVRRKARKQRSDKGVPNPRKRGRHRVYSEPILRMFLDRPTTPLMAREVVDAVFPTRIPSKAEKQMVYQTLYDLKTAGTITQSQVGEPYTLVRQEAAHAA